MAPTGGTGNGTGDLSKYRKSLEQHLAVTFNAAQSRERDTNTEVGQQQSWSASVEVNQRHLVLNLNL